MNRRPFPRLALLARLGLLAMLALLRVAPLLPSPTLRAAAIGPQVGTGKQDPLIELES